MNAICKNCGRTIWLGAYSPDWRHYDTEFARCDITQAPVAEPSDRGYEPTA